MSDHSKKLVIPSHLRLDSLSLNSISTGLTPKGEINSSGVNRGLLSTRSVSGQYSDVQKRLSVQLPSCRSLRTSLRINRNSTIAQQSKNKTKPDASTEICSEKQPRSYSNLSRATRTNVTTPKGFDFATTERAEQRLKQSKPLSSSSYMLKPELGLNLRQVYSGRVPAPPLSARSTSSIGAESRISTLSRNTTIPKPFSFATDARAASKSRELYDRLGGLKNKFNEEVMIKNKEYSEDKRIDTILESIKHFNISSDSSSLNKVSTEAAPGKDTIEGKQAVPRRSTTIPKTPKFATQLRSENKKAQLRGVLDSMLSEEREINSSSWSRSDANSSASKSFTINKVPIQRNCRTSDSSELSYKQNSEPKETSGHNTVQKPDFHTCMQPQKLPKLRGFLSMNSLTHLGRQSFGSLDGSRESHKKSEENSPILNSTSNISGMSSIRKINEENTSIPNNWKFQATIARKQLRQFTGLEETEFSLKELDSCHQPESLGLKNDQNTNILTDDDLKTPLPRTFR
ncbi:hypothetical protein OIY81_2002 [Cryptosporidium canis]|uniref:Uncharacterized protein n=1 Tax=Cryptosporidium canis TaxID=195482 RepID=A0ABQ8PA98_9CRYT|nr:hypothetical protein OIY81_2002 [Cryptosporidium canis]KAJ1613325.1 hypothetical protein OJ252_1001 [Cryptosporidium canis]